MGKTILWLMFAIGFGLLQARGAHSASAGTDILQLYRDSAQRVPQRLFETVGLITQPGEALIRHPESRNAKNRSLNLVRGFEPFVM